MEKREQLYEGKAKKVFATDIPELVIVSYKDDATAFDGKKRGTITGKGIINNRTGEFYSGRILEYGARGFILSYTDDKHVGGDMIPMAYYEFPRPLYSNQDYIKIVWNTNGFVEVE